MLGSKTLTEIPVQGIFYSIMPCQSTCPLDTHTGLESFSVEVTALGRVRLSSDDGLLHFSGLLRSGYGNWVSLTVDLIVRVDIFF